MTRVIGIDSDSHMLQDPLCNVIQHILCCSAVSNAVFGTTIGRPHMLQWRSHTLHCLQVLHVTWGTVGTSSGPVVAMCATATAGHQAVPTLHNAYRHTLHANVICCVTCLSCSVTCCNCSVTCCTAMAHVALPACPAVSRVAAQCNVLPYHCVAADSALKCTVVKPYVVLHLRVRAVLSLDRFCRQPVGKYAQTLPAVCQWY